MLKKPTKKLDEADESLARYLGGFSGVEDWHAARSLVVNENKKFHFGKVAKKWSDVISKGDSKELWNKINWKGEADDSKTFQKKMPSSSDLAAHFLTKGDAHEPLCMAGLPQDQRVEVLDQPITTTELYDTAPLLKDKSTCDGWCPQMITSIHTSLYPLILILFNVILSHAFFPIKWCKTLVAAIFKNNGEKDRYRRIICFQRKHRIPATLYLSRRKVPVSEGHLHRSIIGSAGEDSWES